MIEQGETILAFCDICQEYKKSEVVENSPLDIPRGATLLHIKCLTCGFEQKTIDGAEE